MPNDVILAAVAIELRSPHFQATVRPAAMVELGPLASGTAFARLSGKYQKDETFGDLRLGTLEMEALMMFRLHHESSLTAREAGVSLIPRARTQIAPFAHLSLLCRNFMRP